MSEEHSENWSVSSIYGARTGRGLVQLRVGDRRPFVLTPAEARRVATMLLEGAESATVDEFLMRFLQGEAQIPVEKAALVLEAFRKAREQQP